MHTDEYLLDKLRYLGVKLLSVTVYHMYVKGDANTTIIFGLYDKMFVKNKSLKQLRKVLFPLGDMYIVLRMRYSFEGLILLQTYHRMTKVPK